jgi:hypothetical protein
MADLEENARRRATGKKEIVLSPIAIEIVRRIDALFDIERSINGKSPSQRLATRRALSRPMIDDLHIYMREQLVRLLRPQAMDGFYAVSGRWARLSFQQCRRTRAARHSAWKKIMALLRF